MPLSHAALDTDASSSRCPPAVCVAAVLGDALHRVAVLGGREGMPRSLGSVYGGSVTRFLGVGLRGVASRRPVAMPVVTPLCNGVAVSVDGRSLLVSDSGATHGIHIVTIVGRSPTRHVGSFGSQPLCFNQPHQVYVATDGFVFVADAFNNRVQVLCPDMSLHSVIGRGVLSSPVGVCANADVVVASEAYAGTVAVFNRPDGTLRARFGGHVDGDDRLRSPRGVCFLGASVIAVADCGSNRVSLFTVTGPEPEAGTLLRHIGAGLLHNPQAVCAAAAPGHELVVADAGNRCVRVFSGVGELLMTFGDGDFRGVAIARDNTRVYATDSRTRSCVVFS